MLIIIFLLYMCYHIVLKIKQFFLLHTMVNLIIFLIIFNEPHILSS